MKLLYKYYELHDHDDKQWIYGMNLLSELYEKKILKYKIDMGGIHLLLQTDKKCNDIHFKLAI